MSFVITVNNWNYLFRNCGAAHFSPINPLVADIYSSNWSIAWASRGCIFSGRWGEVSLCRTLIVCMYIYVSWTDYMLLPVFTRWHWANCIFLITILHIHTHISPKKYSVRVRSAQRDVWDLGFGILDSLSVRMKDTTRGEARVRVKFLRLLRGFVYVYSREYRELS